MTKRANAIRAMPVLQVRDVTASVAFYERLGFSCGGIWGEPPGFAIVVRGTVTLGNQALNSGREWSCMLPKRESLLLALTA